MTLTEVALLAVYLATSILAFVGILRTWFDNYGPEWGGVGWALFAFVPVVGQIVGIVLLVAVTLDGVRPRRVPRWLRRIGGQP